MDEQQVEPVMESAEPMTVTFKSQAERRREYLAAAELLNLYARRAARDGYSHRFSPHDYEAFATSIRQLGLFLSVMQVPETS